MRRARNNCMLAAIIKCGREGAMKITRRRLSRAELAARDCATACTGADLACRHAAHGRCLSAGRFDRCHHAAHPGAASRSPQDDDHCRKPCRRLRQRRHGLGGEIAARRQHLAGRLRQPCGQSVRAAAPALRQREGSRSGPAHRHGALSAFDREGKAVQHAGRRHRGGEEKARAPSATARSAAAASDIWRWRS